MPVTFSMALGPPPGSLGLPAGVTLQAIDGETLTSPTTMTKNYFSAYPAAVNKSFNGTSWDDTTFFPVILYDGINSSPASADFSQMASLNINVSIGVTSDTTGTGVSNAGLISAGLWGIPGGYGPGTVGGSPERTPLDVWCPGIHIDEDDPHDVIPLVTNALQDNRFWDLIFTWNQIITNQFTDHLGVNRSVKDLLSLNFYTTPNSTLKSVAMYSCDVYMFAGSPSAVWQAQVFGFNTNPMGLAGSATADQVARGSNYGQMIDVHRALGNGQNTSGVGGNNSATYSTNGAPSRIPLAGVVENVDGRLTDTGVRIITPVEMQWAVWSSIIHGARAVAYFDGAQNFSTTTVGGTSIFLQAQATNLFIQNIAPILNSPFALGYATVSPAGYLFPTPAQNWFGGGMELCVKWYQGTTLIKGGVSYPPGFYILATTRQGEAHGSTSATFTINDPNATSVTPIDPTSGNASANIAISGGQFTDTFTNPWTVKLYRVQG
jgi:hypothetical protein